MKIFHATGENSDRIAVDNHNAKKQLFFTVNGEHVGFLSHEDSKLLADKILSVVKPKPVAKPVAETKPAAKPEAKAKK